MKGMVVFFDKDVKFHVFGTCMKDMDVFFDKCQVLYVCYKNEGYYMNEGYGYGQE